MPQVILNAFTFHIGLPWVTKRPYLLVSLFLRLFSATRCRVMTQDFVVQLDQEVSVVDDSWFCFRKDQHIAMTFVWNRPNEKQVFGKHIGTQCSPTPTQVSEGLAVRTKQSQPTFDFGLQPAL